MCSVAQQCLYFIHYLYQSLCRTLPICRNTPPLRRMRLHSIAPESLCAIMHRIVQTTSKIDKFEAKVSSNYFFFIHCPFCFAHIFFSSYFHPFAKEKMKNSPHSAFVGRPVSRVRNLDSRVPPLLSNMIQKLVDNYK